MGSRQGGLLSWSCDAPSPQLHPTAPAAGRWLHTPSLQSRSFPRLASGARRTDTAGPCSCAAGIGAIQPLPLWTGLPGTGQDQPRAALCLTSPRQTPGQLQKEREQQPREPGCSSRVSAERPSCSSRCAARGKTRPGASPTAHGAARLSTCLLVTLRLLFKSAQTFHTVFSLGCFLKTGVSCPCPCPARTSHSTWLPPLAGIGLWHCHAPAPAGTPTGPRHFHLQPHGPSSRPQLCPSAELTAHHPLLPPLGTARSVTSPGLDRHAHLTH